MKNIKDYKIGDRVVAKSMPNWCNPCWEAWADKELEVVDIDKGYKLYVKRVGNKEDYTIAPNGKNYRWSLNKYSIVGVTPIKRNRQLLFEFMVG